jgi:ATP/maltotriose-dependent transcriptional regulator MalT
MTAAPREVDDGESVAALAAARAAIASHDWQGAHDVLAEVVFDDACLEDAERLDLLADAAWWLGRLDECTAAREAAYRLYDDHGDTRRAASCAVWLYEHHTFAGRGAIAGGWLRRARRAVEGDEECVAFGALLLREAEVAHGSGALDRAVDNARQVIALARRLRCFDLEAEALQTAGRVLIDQGHVTEGMGHLDEAMLFAVEGRLGPYSTGKVYCSLIGACEDLGDYDRAAEWTEATQRWADDHPFCIFPGICRVHRAIVLKRRGSLAEAEREAIQACDELRHSRPVASAAAWAEVGDVCRRLGELDRAEEAFSRATEVSGSPCSAPALLRLAQGRVEIARTIMGGCLEATANPLARASLLPNFVQVAVAAGELDAAAEALGELEQILSVVDSPGGQAAALAARGRLLLARGDGRAARVALQDALERWRALDVPYEAATTGTLLGEALRRCGDEQAAVAAFTTAAALFDQIGARLDARLAGDGARPALTPPRPAGLTEREVEVLRLAAAGLTNSDIAAALYLSAKTVSRHLSNIFSKIGVTSRAGATAFAFEHALVEPRAPATTQR